MSDDEEHPSPFGRPGFIAAAVVVGVIVVLAVVVGITTAGQEEAQPSASQTSAPSPTAPAPDDSSEASGGGESVCGLEGVVTSGRVTTAPDATWDYVGSVAVPTSPVFGPGAKSDEGYHYCFQHSPTGALFAAANSLATASAPSMYATWSEYMISDQVPNKAELVEQARSGQDDTTRSRGRIVGFRVLEYTGDSALVDLAVQASSPQSGTVTASAMFKLVWQDGDWKSAAFDNGDISNVSPIPNTAGYVAWSA